MPSARAGRRWWGSPLALTAACVLLVQTVVLWVLRVPLDLQGAVLLTAAWATAVGAGILRGVGVDLDDAGARFSLRYLVGIVVITGMSYLFFHAGVARLIGLNGPVASARLSLTLAGLAALVVGLRRPPRRTAGHPTRGWDGGLILLLALSLSGATVYGVANSTHAPNTPPVLRRLDPGHPLADSTLPQWGQTGDFYYHLVVRPSQIERQGLPLESAEHHGLQVWLLSATLPFDGFDAADPVQAAKVLSVPVWFSLLSLARYVASGVLGLGQLGSLAAVAAAALFAPVNYPFLATGRSSYLGLISSAGSMYHNSTQLYSVALGMAAVALIGAAGRGGRWNGRFSTAGAGLVAASFWFKPSLFTVLAPGLVVACLLIVREHRREALVCMAILLLPVLWWVAYPGLFGIEGGQMALAFDPLAYYRSRAAARFPAALTAGSWRLAGAVLGLSFAAWVIPVAAWAGRTAGALSRRAGEALATARRSVLPVTLAVALTAGVGMAMLLVEPGERVSHGNFTWSAAAAYVLTIPLLIRLVADLRSLLWRGLFTVLFTIHLAAGALHLFILVSKGHL